MVKAKSLLGGLASTVPPANKPKKHKKRKTPTNKSKLVERAMRVRKRVRNLGITLLVGDKCEIVNMNTNRIMMGKNRTQVGELLRDMTQTKHKWSVLLCVFGRTETGEEYIKTLDVAPPVPCYSNEITEALQAEHSKLYDSFNKNHFVNIGWIAKPNDGEFDEEKVKELFTKLGAFENIAKWELPQFEQA